MFAISVDYFDKQMVILLILFSFKNFFILRVCGQGNDEILAILK